jgi:acyl carrier protein
MTGELSRCERCGEPLATCAPKHASAAPGSAGPSLPPFCPQCHRSENQSLSPSRQRDLLGILRRRISQVLDIPEHHLHAGTPLFEIAGDSMATVELMLVLDEEFSVTLPEECLDEMATLGDLISVIEQEIR